MSGGYAIIRQYHASLSDTHTSSESSSLIGHVSNVIFAGRPPQALRDLYADKALITRRDLRYTDDQVVSTFEPLDEQAILDTTGWLGFEAVAIATTDFGDAAYLRPGAAEVDTVFLTHHDGGDTEVFAESVIEMLRALRQANPST